MANELEQISIERSIHQLHDLIRMRMPDNPVLAGWSAYSQCDEDGIIRECLRRIGLVTPLSNRFLEIGCSDGFENKTHQLVLDGWRGVWIDGDEHKISRLHERLGATGLDGFWAMRQPVDNGNAAWIGARVSDFIGVSSLDFFSLDIDGNDIHVADSFIRLLGPKLVCVPYNAKFHPPTAIAMPYTEGHKWAGDDYFGASLQAWANFMAERDYRLVCCNLSGASAFFVKNELAENFSEYQVQDLYQPSRYWATNVSKGHSTSLKWLKAELESSRYASDGVFVSTELDRSRRFIVHSGNDQYISAEIISNGIWEPFESRIFRKLCREGDFVLDLGANIGWYSVLAVQCVGPSGKVISFEPDPRNINILKRNVALHDEFGVVSVMNQAVADQKGILPLYLSDTNLGDHRLFSDAQDRASCKVGVTTLDTFLCETDLLPTFVKSDTQGSEARILRGAEELFSRGWRPILLLEFWPFGLNASGDDALELWKSLDGMGYTMFEVSEGHHELVASTLDRVVARLESDLSIENQGFINLLCIHSESPRLAEFVAMSVGK